MEEKKGKLYRKKPVIVEVVELTQDNFRWVTEWLWEQGGGKNSDAYWHPDGEDGDRFRCLLIPTPEGTMKALPGDYIIKGTRGEFYPCKPDIFEEIYEVV